MLEVSPLLVWLDIENKEVTLASKCKILKDKNKKERKKIENQVIIPPKNNFIFLHETLVVSISISVRAELKNILYG